MFKSYNPNQSLLLPPSIEEFLWEWHEAVILNEIIEELDLNKLYNSYLNKEKGRPAYNPLMLLKILFYGYMNQVFSSRKIAKKLRTDLWFMYLAWMNQPDFRTINRFRKEKLEILWDIFQQIVLRAKELWLIRFWTINLDGTKIYANASKYNNYDLDWLEKQIEKLFEEAKRIDELEDNKYWEKEENNIPAILQTKEWREKKREKLEKKIKELTEKKEIVKEEIKKKKIEWIEQKRINLTDKDSRLMKMKRKDWWNGYNVQNITENRIILTTRVSNFPEDSKELIPTLQNFYKMYNTFPKETVADKWYGSEKNYNFLEEKNIISYIPHQKTVLNIEEYNYDKEKDIYIDKEGNIYKFKNIENKKNNIKIKRYETVLKNWKKKVISINENWQRLIKENDKRLYSEKWQKIYKKRGWCVENVFWNIKRNLWFERFSLRWFKWVKIEWNLICLAHNLKKIINFQKI